ncbi:MAG TPA: 30S ribosomal protein S20 [Oligoflexia bacterium]|nr:30S ribosomal protein S20 [Oligoflexia bacterium]HMP26679.1 30S ribosomal protein S20 [Oligoflexia bacterium]
MANHKSAIKRHRQSIKKRGANRENKASFRTAARAVRQAISEGQKSDQVEALFKIAESKIQSSARKGVIHPRNSARRISRLRLAINKSVAA